MRLAPTFVVSVTLGSFAAAQTAPVSVDLRLIASGWSQPLGLAHAGDESGRLFVVEQTGAIRVIDGTGVVLPEPFLNIAPLISCCAERGLLGLAFHPDYELNGWFYVNYTDRTGDTILARYTVSANPDVADPGSASVLLRIRQPFRNHNGGHIAFGPDGFLYVAVGDGGSAGDPFGNGQSGRTLLGKILRIDVTAVPDGAPYGIPVDNPFRFDPEMRDELWAIGLRNPWRFSFDRMTGDLFIADVGQTAWEEVSFEPAMSAGGMNYGWRRMEGTHCFDPASNCNGGTLVLPILEYSHEEGCSVTGGFRYRGAEMPEHVGTYFYGDFCSGRIWGARVDETTGAWTSTMLLDSELSIASFGEDAAGELYVIDLAGGLYRLEQAQTQAQAQPTSSGSAVPRPR